MKLKHPHMREVEIDVPAHRVDAHLRAGWVKKYEKRKKREQAPTVDATSEAEVIEESKDG